MDENMKRYYSTSQVAAMCGVTQTTIRRWIGAGFLPGTLKLPGRPSHFRIPASAVAPLSDPRQRRLALRSFRKRSAATKLDNEAARRIRERFAAGDDVHLLADEYGVVKSTIRDVAYGDTWPDAGGPIGSAKRRLKVSDEDVRRIREQHWEQGISQVSLARQEGISRSMVSLLVRGKRRCEAGGPLGPPDEGSTDEA